MKHFIGPLSIIFSLLLFTINGFAQDNLWEKDFVLALQKGKMEGIQSNDGLGYTMSKNSILNNAIKKALAQQAPACETMKIAVDLKYTPYKVIKSIYAQGGDLYLNQVCMCATEGGISKQIIASAAKDATSQMGTPIFQRDEIAQAQCLNEIGLGYSVASALTDAIPPPRRPTPESIAAPTKVPTIPTIIAPEE